MKILKLIFFIIVCFNSVSAQENRTGSDEGSLNSFIKSNEEYKSTKSKDRNNNVGAAENDFLFAQPTKGKLIGMNDNILEDPSLLYNYDKLNKQVVVYADKKPPVKIGLSDFKTVDFITSEGDLWFEPYPAIAKGELFQALIKCFGKYNLYKKIEDKNERDNNNQLYYIISPDNQIHPFKLSKRAVNDILSSNQRAGYFINSHKKDKGDETYVKDFLTYLNYF